MTAPNTSSPLRAAPPRRREPPEYTGSYRWVHLWHLPLRAMHWIAALAIVVLMTTGVLMAKPGAMAGSPRWSFMLQWVRLVHFAAAGVFVATAIVRVYWLFVGNRFERWSALVPVKRSDWVNLWKMLRYYVLVRPGRPPQYLGHNPLQQLLYTLTYLVALLMAVTGFILFGQANPGGLVSTTFAWMAPYFGGVQWVRVIHHALSWFFPTFILVHVYLSIRADVVDRGGMVSSMVSGGRFVDAGERHVDE